MVKKSKFKFIRTLIKNGGRKHIININEDIKYNHKDELDLGYGFGGEMKECNAYEPGKGWEKYRLHSSIHPHEGDKLIHIKSGREFIFGKPSGFVRYIIPLLEDGVEVAIMHFEDYYKD